jgi:hypothetical protein
MISLHICSDAPELMIQVVVVDRVGSIASRTSASSELDALSAEVGNRQKDDPSSSASFAVLDLPIDLAFRRTGHVANLWPVSPQ